MQRHANEDFLLQRWVFPSAEPTPGSDLAIESLS